MKKLGSVFLILSLIMVGCGSDNSFEDAKKQDDRTVTDTVKDGEVTLNEKTGEVKDKEVNSSKETSKNDSTSFSNKPKETDDTSSKTTKPNGSSSNNTTSSNTTTTKPSTPKEEPKVPVEPVKKWSMSEVEMIEYAKKCVVNYKLTSGYGKCEWYNQFNKVNSGWFAPTTLKISKTESELKELIKVTVDSTLKKATSQIYDDGQGNIRPDISYPAKGYIEKVDNEQYKFYVFY